MLNEVIQTIPQVLIDGLALGTVYAVIALGYTMVYGILELINFAHGEIFMTGAFIGTALFNLYDRNWMGFSASCHCYANYCTRSNCFPNRFFGDGY